MKHPQKLLSTLALGFSLSLLGSSPAISEDSPETTLLKKRSELLEPLVTQVSDSVYVAS